MSEEEQVRRRIRRVEIGRWARGISLFVISMGTLYAISLMGTKQPSNRDAAIAIGWATFLVAAPFLMSHTTSFMWELKWGIPKSLDPLDLVEFTGVIAAQIWCGICFIATAISMINMLLRFGASP